MIRSIHCRWSAALALALFVSPHVVAQSTWTNSAGGLWNDPTSWTPNTVPNGGGTVATFGPVASAPVIVGLSADVVAGAITFDAVPSNGSYLIGSSGRTITLASANGTSGTQITVNSNVLGGLTSAMEFVANQTLLVADSGGLSISNLGTSYLIFYGPVVLPNGAPLTVTSVTGPPRGVQFADQTLNGTGPLTTNGPGWVTLSGTQPGLTGTTTINGGGIVIATGTSLGADPPTFVANQLSLNGGSLATSSTATSTVLGATRGVYIGPAGGTLSTANTLQINGAISGSGPIIAGSGSSGRLILSGDNGNYSGAVLVENGTLQLAAPAVLGAPGATTISLKLGAAIELSSSGSATFNSYPLTIAYAGPAGAGALVNVAGANSWTGPITLTITNSTINTAGTSAPLTLRGGVNLAGHQLFLGIATATGGINSTFTIGTVGLSGSGSLSIATGATGSVTIPASSPTFTGQTTVYSGTAILQNSLALGANNAISVNADAVLRLSNNPLSEHPGPVTLGGGPLSLAGGSSTATNGAFQSEGPGNSYAGPITLTAPSTIGVSSLSGPGGLTLTGGINNGGNTLTLTADATSTVTIMTVSISGTGGLVKTGDGTAVLGVGSTYTGPTTVSAGRLLATSRVDRNFFDSDATSAAGTGAVTVAAGGTLGGGDGGSSFTDSTHGFLFGPVSVQGGGTLAPGTGGAGELIVARAGVTFQNGSQFAAYLATNNPRVGSVPADANTNSRILTAADILLGTALTVDIDGGGQTFTPGSTYDYFIGLANGAVGTLPTSVTFVPTDFGGPVYPTDFQLSVSPDQHDLILTYTTAVPEPGSVALLTVAVATGWRLRRVVNRGRSL